MLKTKYIFTFMMILLSSAYAASQRPKLPVMSEKEYNKAFPPAAAKIDLQKLTRSKKISWGLLISKVQKNINNYDFKAGDTIYALNDINMTNFESYKSELDRVVPKGVKFSVAHPNGKRVHFRPKPDSLFINGSFSWLAELDYVRSKYKNSKWDKELLVASSLKNSHGLLAFSALEKAFAKGFPRNQYSDLLCAFMLYKNYRFKDSLSYCNLVLKTKASSVYRQMALKLAADAFLHQGNWHGLNKIKKMNPALLALWDGVKHHSLTYEKFNKLDLRKEVASGKYVEVDYVSKIKAGSRNERLWISKIQSKSGNVDLFAITDTNKTYGLATPLYNGEISGDLLISLTDITPGKYLKVFNIGFGNAQYYPRKDNTFLIGGTAAGPLSLTVSTGCSQINGAQKTALISLIYSNPKATLKRQRFKLRIIALNGIGEIYINDQLVSRQFFDKKLELHPFVSSVGMNAIIVKCKVKCYALKK